MRRIGFAPNEHTFPIVHKAFASLLHSLTCCKHICTNVLNSGLDLDLHSAYYGCWWPIWG